MDGFNVVKEWECMSLHALHANTSTPPDPRLTSALPASLPPSLRLR